MSYGIIFPKGKKVILAKPNEKTILLISAFEFHIEKLDTVKTILESKYSSAIPVNIFSFWFKTHKKNEWE